MVFWFYGKIRPTGPIGPIGLLDPTRFTVLSFMLYFFCLSVFIFGTIIGSFLNVIICRLATGEGVVRGRSHCVKCGCFLAWRDLIPIVSFFMLRGRCRGCRCKISIQYPLVEIITGLLFLSVFYLNYESMIMNYGHELSSFSMIHDSLFIIQLLFYWFIVSCLAIIFVYDLRHYIIPDKILFPAIAGSLIWRGFLSLKIGHWSLIENWSLVIGHFFPYFLAAIVASAFFLFLILITRGRGMGLGDAKLAVLMGLLLGWPNILIALFLAFFSGALVGVSLIIAGRKTMQSQIPFGPFLIFGTLVALFWGQAIAELYLNFSFFG